MYVFMILFSEIYNYNLKQTQPVHRRFILSLRHIWNMNQQLIENRFQKWNRNQDQSLPSLIPKRKIIIIILWLIRLKPHVKWDQTYQITIICMNYKAVKPSQPNQVAQCSL